MNFGANRHFENDQHFKILQKILNFLKFSISHWLHIDLGISSSFIVPSSFQILSNKKPVIENQGSADILVTVRESLPKFGLVLEKW